MRGTVTSLKRVTTRLAAVLLATGLITGGAFAQEGQEQEAGGGEQDTAATTGDRGPARVLIAPLETSGDIDEGFGSDIAEEVRAGLGEFPGMRAITEDEIEEELDALEIDKEDLGLVQWRQLAGRIGADIVMLGTVEPQGGNYALNVTFTDVKTNDELSVPEFTIPSDDEDQAAEQIVSAFRQQVDYRRALAYCRDYLASKQFESALRNCNRALEENPDSQQGLYLLGRIYMGMEEWEQAREPLTRVVAESPANTSALQSLAYTCAQLGDTECASELYREVLNFTPKDVDVRLKVAYDLATAGAYDEAIAILQEGIAQDSTNARLWEFIGNVALAKGTASAPDSLGGTAPEEGGTAPDGERGMQDTTGAAGITDSAAVRLAIDAYEHVLALKGDSVDARMLRNVVSAYAQLGEYERALQFAEQARQRLPDDPTLWSVTADVLANMERYGDAAEALTRVVELDPDYKDIYIRRGLYLLRSGQQRAAMGDFRRAIERGMDPTTVGQQLFARGYQNYFQRGDYPGAIELFDAALEFVPAGQVANQMHFFIGWAHYQQAVQIDNGNPNEACAPARRALDQFQQVTPSLDRAADYQASSQQQIRSATDTYIYRQQQIIEKSC